MEQTNHLGPEADAAETERKQLGEIQSLLDAFNVLEGAFATLATSAELKTAEGRRCILSISGLKHHAAAYFFEVLGSRVRQVQPFDNYTTYIAAPIDSVLRVLKGVLEGDEDCFANEWARGQAKLVGTHSLHDGVQFGDAFRRLARLIKRYRALVTAE